MIDTAADARATLLLRELGRLIEVLSSDMRTEQVWLFGSVAEGNIRQWTDLDVVVIAESDLPFFERTKQILNSVCPKVGMDILVYTPAEWEEMRSSRPFIRQEVVEKGRIVYERSR